MMKKKSKNNLVESECSFCLRFIIRQHPQLLRMHLAKTYEVVSLETARNIAKKFKASLKQKTDLYVIEGILIDAGYQKEPVNL